MNRSKGRRVSFGAIRAIPTTAITLHRTNSNGAFEATQEAESFDVDSELKAERVSTPPPSETDSSSPRVSSPVSASSLSEYIDNIVQKTIDEVLVLE